MNVNNRKKTLLSVEVIIVAVLHENPAGMLNNEFRTEFAPLQYVPVCRCRYAVFAQFTVPDKPVGRSSGEYFGTVTVKDPENYIRFGHKVGVVDDIVEPVAVWSYGINQLDYGKILGNSSTLQ